MPDGAPGTALSRVLADCGTAVIAVSGGVDSMTLSAFAHRLRGGEGLRMVHAVSPAVPAAASERVRALAVTEGWHLDVLDAGEFADARYRANPVDRCFFCKSNLYGTLAGLAGGVVLSGTNCDDLGDYRPGLVAAADNGVRHPYVEAGMAKRDVRALARDLGLDDLAELPSAPCLASRVETGLRIEPEEMILIDGIETWLRRELAAGTVRCRLRARGVEIELEESRIERMTEARLADLRRLFPQLGDRRIEVGAYRRGSAFIHPGEAAE